VLVNGRTAGKAALGLRVVSKTGRSAPSGWRCRLTRAGAAAETLLWRRQVIADLEAAGVLTLDARPEDLTAALVSEYLTIKARRLL